MSFPLTGRVVAQSLATATEVWISSDILWGLAQADRALLVELLDFLGGRFAITPDNRRRITAGLASSEARERQTAQALSATVYGRRELEDLLPLHMTETAERASRATAREWTTMPPEVALAAAELVVSARLARGEGKRVVVIVIQTVRAAKLMPDGAAIGFHHVAACLGRSQHLDKNGAVGLWERLEGARAQARLPFLGRVADAASGPVPHRDTEGEFIGYVVGDDEAEF